MYMYMYIQLFHVYYLCIIIFYLHIHIYIYITHRVSHSGGCHPPPTIFRKTSIKTNAPQLGAPPFPLKNEASLSEKYPPSPLLKREAPFHEMIPRKTEINNNLKYS